MPSHNTVLRNIMNGAIKKSKKEDTSEAGHFYYRISHDLVRVDETNNHFWRLTGIDEQHLGFFPRLTKQPEKDIESALNHQNNVLLAQDFLTSYILMKSNEADGAFVWDPKRSQIMKLSNQKILPMPYKINQAISEFTKNTVLLNQEYEEIIPCCIEIALQLPHSAHKRMHFIQQHDSLLNEILG